MNDTAGANQMSGIHTILLPYLVTPNAFFTQITVELIFSSVAEVAGFLIIPLLTVRIAIADQFLPPQRVPKNETNEKKKVSSKPKLHFPLRSIG